MYIKKALFLLISLSVANLGFGYGAYVKNYTDKYVCFRVEYQGIKHDYEVIVPPHEAKKDGGAWLNFSVDTKAWVYLGDDVPAKLDWGEISKWQLVGEETGYIMNASQNWGLFTLKSREADGKERYALIQFGSWTMMNFFEATEKNKINSEFVFP